MDFFAAIHVNCDNKYRGKRRLMLSVNIPTDFAEFDGDLYFFYDDDEEPTIKGWQ